VVFSGDEEPSADAVRELNDRAGTLVSRIVDAALVAGDQAKTS
jgi:hypothetical protein